MTAEQDKALDVLRAVWRGQGQTAAELADEAGETKACKRMSDVGFDGFADGDSDVRAGWRETLAREGKLRPAASSVRDLVLGDAESSFR
jgi:hypothetical protein